MKSSKMKKLFKATSVSEVLMFTGELHYPHFITKHVQSVMYFYLYVKASFKEKQQNNFLTYLTGDGAKLI